eukprot:4045015-Pleurochrysis_carterae.AAC.4
MPSQFAMRAKVPSAFTEQQKRRYTKRNLGHNSCIGKENVSLCEQVSTINFTNGGHEMAGDEMSKASAQCRQNTQFHT